jgi:hypothetical protein
MRSPQGTVKHPRPHALTSALVAVVVSAQLLGAAHLALVQHAVCWEHGDLVDLPRAGASTAIGSAPHTSRVRPGLEASASVIESPQHRHCDALARREDSALPPRAELRFIRIELPAGPLAPVVAVAGARAALLRLAPKQSPPSIRFV